MGKIKKVSAAAAGALLLSAGLVLALLPGAASATPGRVHGTEYFVISGVEGDATATASGLFAGSGRDHDGNVRDIMHLTPGRIEIRHPDKKSHFTYKINQKTCGFAYVITGEYTLHMGTGRFTGLRGHGTYIGHGSATFARSADGSCDTQSSPTGFAQTIRARGPASLPAAA